jgi:hypothetical protein
LFTVDKINAILKNPRYAGLAVWDGEVVARGHWPAYVTERQHERIKRRLAVRPSTKVARVLEAYLLSGVGSCGRCGKPLYVVTGSRRRDGTFRRRYTCAGHVKERGRAQCVAAPIDAHTAEAMVISSIGALLIGNPEHETTREPDLPIRREAAQRLREVILSGDEKRLAEMLEHLFAAMEPEAALIRDAAISQRQARELAEATRLRAWIEQEASGRTEDTRAQARELDELLRKWFSNISITVESDTVVISATRRGRASAATPPHERRASRGDSYERFSPSREGGASRESLNLTEKQRRSFLERSPAGPAWIAARTNQWRSREASLRPRCNITESNSARARECRRVEVFS